MEMASENIVIQRQYKQGFAIKQERQQEKTKEVKPSTDITKEQWFWDMAVLS